MKRTCLAASAVWVALVAPAFGEPPEPMEILKQAQAAAREVKAVSYEADMQTEGALARALEGQRGKVVLVRPSGGGLSKVRVDSADGSPGLQLVCDGQTAWLIDHAKKEFVKREGAKAGKLIAKGGTLLAWDLVSTAPYQREIAANSAAYLGTQQVDGVECDVVSVVMEEGQVEVRWYFDRERHLPRRVERILSDELSGGGKLTSTLKSLEVNPPITDDMFRVEKPEGYGRLYLDGELRPVDPATVSAVPRALGERGRPDEARKPPAKKLLEVGALAPDWSLKTPEGKLVTLKELQGKVAALNFWASWRPVCKQAMAHMQKMHDYYKDRAVVVYGISMLEPDDPAEIMKRWGLTYGLLLNGETVASEYGVADVPVVYVIGPDGKVLYAADGVGSPAKMRQTIDEALKEMEKK